MTTIKALETHYAGCRFRSRLEARWAVFFDTLGIRWEYEPQGFSTPDGPYLPDFLLHLPDGDIWFEVKPADNDDDDPRWRHLAEATGISLVNANGMPRPGDDLIWGGVGVDGWMQIRDDGWDNGRAFCVCPSCGNVGMEFEGRSERMRCCPTKDGDYDKHRTYDHPRIVRAYRAANSARFEHGERG